MTAMGAGGAVEDNIKRWAGQFSAPGAGDVQPKIEKMQVGGQVLRQFHPQQDRSVGVQRDHRA